MGDVQGQAGLDGSGPNLTISIEQDAPPEVQRSIAAILDEEADKVFGYPFQIRSFCAVLRHPDGTVQGGIIARCYWDWLRVETLAVAAQWRGHGYGRSLLDRAEQWGLSCSCHDVWLTTMGSEARRFYERAGYRIFAELPHFPGALTRLFMRKPLTEPN